MVRAVVMTRRPPRAAVRSASRSSGARSADFISSDVRARQVEDRRFDAEGVGPGCCCVTLAVKGWNDRKAKGDQDTGPIGSPTGLAIGSPIQKNDGEANTQKPEARSQKP